MPDEPSTPPFVPTLSLAFLRGLQPAGPWLLVAINPDPPEDQPRGQAHLGEFDPEHEADLVAWLTKYYGRWNLYYTSNLPAHAPFRTAKKDAVRSLRCLHVDLDLPGSADDAALLERHRNLLQHFDPPPTALIFTGGGHQAIWRFPEQDGIPASDWTERVEKVNTAIWRAIGGDHCHDVSRLLRLPGTLNVPNAKKRARGRVANLSVVVDVDWTRTWSITTDAVPRVPEGELPETEAPANSSAASSGILDALTPALRKLIKTGDPTRFAGDRSRLGWYVTCELLRRSWSDDDLIRVLLDPAHGISAHYLDQPSPPSYVQRNIVRAREAIASDWNRHPKTNAVLIQDQDNIDKALRQFNIKLSYDALADRTWVNGSGPARLLSDHDVNATWLRVQAEFNWLPHKDFFSTVVATRARENTYHPVLDYLERVQPLWDGVRRIGHVEDTPSWLTTYGMVDDTPYTRAVGRLTLVAAVRRMRDPGCKFDEMLMLVDPTQGSNKSSAVAALAVKDEWFNDYVPIGAVGREVIEHVRGFWIIEAAEMEGMTTRELEKIKGFCSRRYDRGRMSYDKLITDLPRSCVFIGTTNETHLFTDLENRRFWPVRLNGEFDIAALRRDVTQLWAEAAQAEATGETIELVRELWSAAAAVQASYRIEDSWTTLIDQAIGNLSGRITSVDLYKILNKQVGNTYHLDNRRMGRAMRDLGFTHQQMRTPNSPRQQWFYWRGERDLDLYVFRDPVTGDVSVSPAPEEPPEPAERNFEF